MVVLQQFLYYTSTLNKNSFYLPKYLGLITFPLVVGSIYLIGSFRKSKSHLGIQGILYKFGTAYGGYKNNGTYPRNFYVNGWFYFLWSTQGQVIETTWVVVVPT